MVVGFVVMVFDCCFVVLTVFLAVQQKLPTDVAMRVGAKSAQSLPATQPNIPYRIAVFVVEPYHAKCRKPVAVAAGLLRIVAIFFLCRLVSRNWGGKRVKWVVVLIFQILIWRRHD